MIGVSARTVKSVATTAALPARKPVYLDGVERMRVRAGVAALAIVRQGWETVRLPIARISRVIASRSVDWDSEALILCLRHAVPIIFLDTDGQALGAWTGTDWMVAPIPDHILVGGKGQASPDDT